MKQHFSFLTLTTIILLSPFSAYSVEPTVSISPEPLAVEELVLSDEPSITPEISPDITDSPTPSPSDTPTPDPTTTLAPTAPLPPSVTPTPSPLVIQGLEVQSSNGYEWQILEANSPIYTDRNYTYTTDVLEFHGAAYLMTANNDKQSNHKKYMSFTLEKPATVYVAHDDRIKKKPDWLKKWKKSGKKVFIFNAHHTLYEKKYNAGKVTLGGNKTNKDTNKDRSMYTVFVVDSETNTLPPASETQGTLFPFGESFGPDFPTCTEGEVIGTFGTYTLGLRTSHPNEIEVFVETPADFTARAGTVQVLQGEGHNWDEGYEEVSGPKSSLGSLPAKAKQFQKHEIAEFYWQGTSSLMFLGAFTDLSPNGGNSALDKDNITTEYSFPVTMIQPGVNKMTIKVPATPDNQVTSVFVKGTVCAGEIIPSNTPSPTIPVTPSPTDTPTPTITPSPTPTVSPAPLQNAWGYEVISSFQGIQKNRLPVRVERSNPGTTLGELDGTFFSLGMGGEIVIGFECRIQNIDGPDLALYESTFNRENYSEERALVEVSQDGTEWYTLSPVASNQTPVAPFSRTPLSLDSTPLEWFQFLRLKDATIFTITPFDDMDGYDVNAVEGFAEVCE